MLDTCFTTAVTRSRDARRALGVAALQALLFVPGVSARAAAPTPARPPRMRLRILRTYLRIPKGPPYGPVVGWTDRTGLLIDCGDYRGYSVIRWDVRSTRSSHLVKLQQTGRKMHGTVSEGYPSCVPWPGSAVTGIQALDGPRPFDTAACSLSGRLLAKVSGAQLKHVLPLTDDPGFALTGDHGLAFWDWGLDHTQHVWLCTAAAKAGVHSRYLIEPKIGPTFYYDIAGCKPGLIYVGSQTRRIGRRLVCQFYIVRNNGTFGPWCAPVPVVYASGIGDGISWDGRYLASCRGRSPKTGRYELYVYDMVRGRLVGSIDLPGNPMSIIWRPDSGAIFLVFDSGPRAAALVSLHGWKL